MSDGLSWKLEGRSFARQCQLTRGLVPMLCAPGAHLGDSSFHPSLFVFLFRFLNLICLYARSAPLFYLTWMCALVQCQARGERSTSCGYCSYIDVVWYDDAPPPQAPAATTCLRRLWLLPSASCKRPLICCQQSAYNIFTRFASSLSSGPGGDEVLEAAAAAD